MKAATVSPRRVSVTLAKGVRGVTASRVKRIVAGALAVEGANRCSVSVLVTGDREIRRINKRFLKHDYATDVISFGQDGGVQIPGQEDFLGDLVVSADFARAYAKKHALAFSEELARYLVHGSLHLLGWEDDTPDRRARMHARQESILKRLKLLA